MGAIIGTRECGSLVQFWKDSQFSQCGAYGGETEGKQACRLVGELIGKRRNGKGLEFCLPR
jgi:hypothetical protein